VDSIVNGPKVSDIETAGLGHCTLRLSGDGVSALATDPAKSAVRMTLSTRFGMAQSCRSASTASRNSRTFGPAAPP
jgi:hypothetical protein